MEPHSKPTGRTGRFLLSADQVNVLFLPLGVLLSLWILGCSPGPAWVYDASAVCETPGQVPGFVGKKIIVTFRWEHPTSVREGLMIRGRLVKADESVLVLRDEGDMSKGTLPAVLTKLQKYGKVRVEEGLPREFVIDRTDVADLFCSPSQDCWCTRGTR